MSFRAVVSNTVEVTTDSEGKYRHQVSVTFFDLTQEELYKLLDNTDRETGTTTLSIK